jgi:signal transduction histidine kinase
MTFNDEIERGEIYFQSDSRLLLELGERLVATREVAITELVKNAYDADSAFCRVWKEERNGEIELNVLDAGHGITIDEFRKNWMIIATSQKSDIRFSRIYQRKMTGAKGIGRFAVRFLGSELELRSIAYDPERESRTQLIAKFNWSQFTPGKNLNEIKIPYALKKVDENNQIGTHLIIKSLYEKWDEKIIESVKDEVLKITSPISGLEAGPFKKKAVGNDPGFEVFFLAPDDSVGDETGEAANVLRYSWARLIIKVEDGKIDYIITFRDGAPGFKYTYTLDNKYLEGLYADIRFFPYRKGVFRGIPDISGRKAQKWVKDNSGIAIFDHGFRIPPYGYEDDDWLSLSADKASNRRKWRSPITETVYPSNQRERIEKLDPALFLPANHQLVGAVFLESNQDTINDKSTDYLLIPAMDRQGYVENKAFLQLQNIVRAGIEFLAVIDKKDQLRREYQKVEQERLSFKEEINEAKQYVESSIDMPVRVKRQLIHQFKRIETQFEDLDQAHIKARESIELMSTLGVVAGFMTHESQRIFRDIGRLIAKFSEFSKVYEDPELVELIETAKASLKELKGYLDYTDTFIKGIHVGQIQEFKARPQVERIIQKFGKFVENRGIIIENKIDPDVNSAPTLVTLYSGILLNLYTNALKAVLARRDPNTPRKIQFRAWNEAGWHIVQVIDNGIGIPPSLEDRIWDPLFSTTSSGVDPLGSGMGLGLSIIKRLITSIKGKIALISPPEGFSTCFEVRFKQGRTE